MKNEMYFIEKGIVVPKRWGSKYPFEEMEVGDSFFAKANSGSLLTMAKYFIKKNKNDWKFVSRKEGDGVRIWRTK